MTPNRRNRISPNQKFKNLAAALCNNIMDKRTKREVLMNKKPLKSNLLKTRNPGWMAETSVKTICWTG
eukprot:13897564-Heterocapsa_arctica.AAC.1